MYVCLKLSGELLFCARVHIKCVEEETLLNIYI